MGCKGHMVPYRLTWPVLNVADCCFCFGFFRSVGFHVIVFHNCHQPCSVLPSSLLVSLNDPSHSSMSDFICGDRLMMFRCAILLLWSTSVVNVCSGAWTSLRSLSRIL